MYYLLPLLLSILFSSSDELPQGLTEWELDNMHIIDEMRFRTDPPPGPIRNISEFERMSGVLIRYPFGISTSVIREMAEDIKVYCLVSSRATNLLLCKGIKTLAWKSKDKEVNQLLSASLKKSCSR